MSEGELLIAFAAVFAMGYLAGFGSGVLWLLFAVGRQLWRSWKGVQ